MATWNTHNKGRHYIHLTWALAVKNLKVKYKNSLLGFLWSLINPLLFLLIFNYVFGHAFPDIKNYPLYAITGIVLWTLFPVATQQIIQAQLENAGILKSVAIKAEVFPVSAMLSAALNFYLLLIPFFGLMLYLGMPLSWSILPGLVILHLFLIFILGIGMLLGALNVFYRDIGLLWNTLMPALFYFTPIAYPVSLIPTHLQWAIQLNPVYYYVHGFRTAVYEQAIPTMYDWVWMCSISMGTLVLGWVVFKTLKKHFISFY